MFLRGIDVEKTIRIERNRVAFINLDEKEGSDFKKFFNTLPKRKASKVEEACEEYMKDKKFSISFKK